MIEWIVLQRNLHGKPKEFFHRTFEEYRQGFSGDGELWLGLEKMHELTSKGRWEIQFDLMQRKGYKIVTARFSEFRIGPGPRSV